MERALPRPIVLPNLARVVVIGIVGIFFATYWLVSNPFDPANFAHDTAIYRDAAARLAGGESLYPPQEGEMLYRYAPWFAAVWTVLPGWFDWAWMALLVGCSAVLLWPAMTVRNGWMLALLFTPMLMENAWVGNAEPLVLCLMALWPSRLGPVGIGAAASLKLAPLAFVILYVVRREWGKALATLAVFAVLWLPGVPAGVLSNPTGPTTMSLSAISPLLGLAVAGAVFLLGAWMAWRTRYRVFGAGLMYIGMLVPRAHIVHGAVGLLALRPEQGDRGKLRLRNANPGR